MKDLRPLVIEENAWKPTNEGTGCCVGGGISDISDEGVFDGKVRGM